MDRREFIKLAGAGLASAILPASAGRSVGSRPNILVICSDEHNASKLGYRNHPLVRTPNLDKLAAEGAHFTRAYCNSPVCIPSRMSFLTGKYVHELGVWLNGVKLPPEETTWADRLAAAGYETSAYGMIGLVGLSEDAGFQDIKTRSRHPVYTPWPFESPFSQRTRGFYQNPWWLTQGPNSRENKLRQLAAKRKIRSVDGLHLKEDLFQQIGYFDQDRETTDQTLTRLRELGRSGGKQPWLHFAGFKMPHWPYICPEKYLKLYDPDAIDLPKSRLQSKEQLHPAVADFKASRPFEANDLQLRKLALAYYGMITCMDDLVGEVLAELKAQGFHRNTYVIYLSDHGESLGEHGLFGKQTSYEGSVGVPLIMRGPGIDAGRRIDDVVHLVDLLPTLLDMAGVSREDTGVGTSRLPLLQGSIGSAASPILSEYHGGYFLRDWYLVVRGDFKYTHYSGSRPSLFNLREDPLEETDLALDPASGPLLAEFDRELRSIVDPEKTTRRVKRDCGLIGPAGEDYTETLTRDALVRGRRSGRFGPDFKRVMIR